MLFQYLQLIAAGLLVSLSGSLPLGNLNVTAMQIAATGAVKRALWFAVGVSVVEMFYLRFTLSAIDIVKGYDSVFNYLRIFTIVLLLVLAAGSFMANVSKGNKNIVVNNKAKGWVLGAGMSLLNPMQVPFWLGWGIYLIAQSVLRTDGGSYNIFTLSAGVGTFVALIIFILAGRRFSGFMKANQKRVNIFMGCLFLIMAGFQFVEFL